MAFDNSGNLFIADIANNIIEKIDTNGNITIFAGIISSTGGSPTPGLATNSYLCFPSAIATDPSGNVYIVDLLNYVIEKVTPNGTLSIVAGIIGLSGNLVEGIATNSPLGYITGIAVDYQGNIYIADGNNSRIAKITASGILSFFAGTGYSGKPFTGQSALDQPFSAISCIAVDKNGNVYGGDSDSSVIFKITPTGNIYVIAGYYTYTGSGYESVHDTPISGIATNSSFRSITGIAVDSDGNVYVSDLDSKLIVKINLNGYLAIVTGINSVTNPTFSIIVGTGYDTNSTTVSTLNGPVAIATDISGYLYVCDQNGATSTFVVAKVNIETSVIPPPPTTITYTYTTIPNSVSYINLLHNTSYRLTVQSVYSDNTYTYTIPINTLNESAVTNISYSNLGNTSAYIYFNTSPGNSPTYLIKYQGTRIDTRIRYATPNPPTATNVNLTGLTINVPYDITVTTIYSNNNLYSYTVNSLFTTLNQGLTQISSITNITTTSFNIVYINTYERVNSYLFTIKQNGTTITTATTFGSANNTRTVTITGLTSGQTYNITILTTYNDNNTYLTTYANTVTTL
jgi:sugar lactone lactonase YvrE